MLKEKIELVTEDWGGEPYEYFPLGKYVVCSPGVCSGRPVFKYTRIEVSGILNKLAAGQSAEYIASRTRGRVSLEAILEAINLAAEQFEENTSGIASET